ncbi:MAG: nicotinamide riboside transporter PnuC [Chthonomonadales bacterium]
MLGAYHIGYVLPTTPLEVWIFLSGALAVWLAVVAHISNWPVGIINVILWIFLFNQQKLYANAWLQVIYIVSGFLGWYWWVQKKDGEALPIAKASAKLNWGLWIACFALSYPTYLLLLSIGGASAYWDGLTTLISLAGQFLLMKKYRENWWFWIVVDVIYVALFISQKLYLSAQLYAILLVMCIHGVRTWTTEEKQVV